VNLHNFSLVLALEVLLLLVYSHVHTLCDINFQQTAFLIHHQAYFKDLLYTIHTNICSCTKMPSYPEFLSLARARTHTHKIAAGLLFTTMQIPNYIILKITKKRRKSTVNFNLSHQILHSHFFPDWTYGIS
jgi:hypothetical protein